MTSLFVTIVAIVLFAIVSLISIMYIDVENANATTQAPVVAAAMGNMLEVISEYRAANNAVPTSVAVLSGFTDVPSAPNIAGAYWLIRNQDLCLVLPSSDANRLLFEAAAPRVSSTAGVSSVSTSCGGTALGGEITLRTSL